MSPDALGGRHRDLLALLRSAVLSERHTSLSAVENVGYCQIHDRDDGTVNVIAVPRNTFLTKEEMAPLIEHDYIRRNDAAHDRGIVPDHNRVGVSTMADLTLEQLRTELAPVKAALDGLPMLNRAVTVLQQDVRALRAAFNDFAKTNLTSGEIDALHFDVNRVQADNTDLVHRITTLERLAREHGWE
jgi:hypothetical protein